MLAGDNIKYFDNSENKFLILYIIRLPCRSKEKELSLSKTFSLIPLALCSHWRDLLTLRFGVWIFSES